MKKKIGIVMAIFFFTPIVLALIIYLFLTAYYARSFTFGVFVNGVYATGKTPEEVNEYLMDMKLETELVIQDKFGKVSTLSFEEIGYTYSYMEPLEELQKKQNPFLWLMRLEGNQSYTITPHGTFDEQKFEKAFESLETIKKASDKNNIVVEIVKNENGYELLDTTANLLDKEKSRQCIEEALKKGVYFIDLTESDCYEEFDYTSQMEDTLALYQKIERFTAGKITYLFDGKEIVVDKAVTSDWILLDENGGFVYDELGELVLDEKVIPAYVEGLAEEFDTVNRDREFLATRGETVIVPAGTYGNKLDRKKEVEYLTEAFLAKRVEEHEPIYSQRAWGSGTNDIGDTYIEVDLTQQKLYYYENGVQKINTDVVTGNTSRRNGTPQRACYVYFMQKNRVLRGADYATPVDYWMAVYGNIGIHDATWRGKFGGTIYKTNGSHGCINTPYKEVSKLYGMVEIGTPVMIFY